MEGHIQKEGERDSKKEKEKKKHVRILILIFSRRENLSQVNSPLIFLCHDATGLFKVVVPV